MKQQAGFTLIELIMVIVILGILAATALPRFANLQGDARAASANGALASMSSAAAIAHAVFLARNTAAGSSVVIEGATATNTNGYPARTEIGALAGLNAANYASSVSASSVTVTPTGAAAATCSATYTEAATSAVPPAITTTPSPLTNVGCS